MGGRTDATLIQEQEAHHAKVCPALACIFVVIVLLTAAPAASQEVWSATLTVAEFEFTTDRADDRRLLGYKAEHGEGNPFAAVSFGELSDVDFIVNGVTYTLTGLYAQSDETGTEGALFIHLDPVPSQFRCFRCRRSGSYWRCCPPRALRRGGFGRGRAARPEASNKGTFR